MRETASENAGAHHAVADEHHRSVKACSRAITATSAPPARSIDRISGRFDHGHGYCEHQRAERLAHAMRNELRMMNRGDARCP
jgi:hypothetical protein